MSDNDGDGYENITSEFAQVIHIGGRLLDRGRLLEKGV